MQVKARGNGDPERTASSGWRRTPTIALLPLAALLVVALAATGCDAGEQPAPVPPTPTAAKPTQLTFGVYGPEDEVTAFQGVVDVYNAPSNPSNVRIRSWADHDSFARAIREGTKLPDVFLASRSDLAWLREQHLTQPVDGLLDERGVDFGDGYSRDALQAFSADNRIQCMPFGISPMVIYYNKALIDFDRMRARGLDAPELTDTDAHWNFEQFTAAAKFASRPARGTRGLYVDPTLRGLAPFIYSGGGNVFDDEHAPTSTAFSDSDTRAALERTLLLLRDPHLTLTDRQLARATPLQWFERGRLGMIEGFRNLVPQLRQVQGLEFDVMPMPSLDGAATVGDITGMCLSAKAASTPLAADFLVHALSAESVGRVVRAGYLDPANLQVALSDEFLQPGRLPAHSGVFNSSVRSMVIAPLLDSWTELEAAVAPTLRDLLTLPVLDDLEGLSEQIDEESRTVLDPESASPSAG